MFPVAYIHAKKAIKTIAKAHINTKHLCDFERVAGSALPCQLICFGIDFFTVNQHLIASPK
jgi:hypothetical protein